MFKNEKDAIIGKKLRQLRNIKGISQSELAGEAGVTFQQVQKYEKGINRISSGRLHDFSEILGVGVNIFYDEVDKELSGSGKKVAFAEAESDKFVAKDILDSKETLNLVREYYKIKEPSKRKHIIEVIKAMNESEGE